MKEQFNFNEPFTLSEFVAFYGLGNVSDPRVSRPIVKVLTAKGYSFRVIKRKRKWAKWPEYRPFVMPDIP